MKKAIHSRRAAAPKLSTKLPAYTRLSQAGAWLAIAVFVFVSVAALQGRNHLVVPADTAVFSSTSAETPKADPFYLSDADRARYHAIHQLHTQGDFSAADAHIETLVNRGLLGYALADRYLSTAYRTTDEELRAWLHTYHDHPQATRIASLAAAHGIPAQVTDLPAPLRGDGGSDHLGRSSMPDAWFTALEQWRTGDYQDAFATFAALSNQEELSPWQSAAAAFWAYRAADKLGDDAAADRYLRAAASADHTFYGLIAHASLGTTSLSVEAPEVSNALRRNPHAVRAALLTQLGKSEAAEQELRQLYASASPSDRKGIVTLASDLALPNLQMRLARTPGLSEAEQRFAHFPMPHYMVRLHPIMDSALLMAVARNESAFREVAQSSAGAVGMMQMLPSTARSVERHVGEDLLRLSATGDAASVPIAERLNDPALSARYGAEYLKMIANQPAVKGNLVHLLTGYNAGIGRVISWKAMAGGMQDPLLYIESMPFAETRNYVMQVSAQYWTYQMMMDESPETLKQLAQGHWPSVSNTPKQ
jgi:soluble lytic murein transglycosylase-like protein